MSRIIATLALIATIAHAETFTLPAPMSLTFTATTAEYNVSRYDTTTGNWTIDVRLNYELAQPIQAEARMQTWFTCEVTAQELAAYFEIPEGTVSETKTGAEISAAVQAIAFSKVTTAYTP